MNVTFLSLYLSVHSFASPSIRLSIDASTPIYPSIIHLPIDFPPSDFLLYSSIAKTVEQPDWELSCDNDMVSSVWWTSAFLLTHFWQGAESITPATQSDAWTCNSGPNMVCLSPFDFEFLFTSQQRALFHLSTSKSGSNTWCLYHFPRASERRVLLIVGVCHHIF